MKSLTGALTVLVLSLPISVLADTASALANAPNVTAQELYAAQNKGLSLYGSKDYQEASPHLMKAAQHGLKNAQATLGLMHLTGNGVERSAQLGIGWLGVAADGKAGSRIKKTYNDAIESIPKSIAPSSTKLLTRLSRGTGPRRTVCAARAISLLARMLSSTGVITRIRDTAIKSKIRSRRLVIWIRAAVMSGASIPVAAVQAARRLRPAVIRVAADVANTTHE